MNKIQQKIKDYIIAHIGKPEEITPTDLKVIDFLIVGLPSFLGNFLMFILISAVYLWALNKYGFEKTLIVLLANLIISVSQVGSALKSLSQ